MVQRLRAYVALIKCPQTVLLLFTGVAGYVSARCPLRNELDLLALTTTLFLAISGGTVLNMVYDRDIDAVMERACRRPLPSGSISVRGACILGWLLSLAGLGGAFALGALYGAVVLVGWLVDVVVYTMWLKRRTPWSIVWGGIAGAMPTLAGRVYGSGQIDLVGGLLALAILLWVPTHMLTFTTKYADQYRRAGVPVWVNRYGEWSARLAIALSCGAASTAIVLAAWQIGLAWRYFHIVLWLGLAFCLFAALGLVTRRPWHHRALYRAASLYMLGAMVIIMAGILM